ncbi:MAG: site-specific tyrosine recombinase XerD [Bacteroidales bacterium]|nr:site-specific tyrosine recombinase XerD [Bacteroidales bacterium]
MDWEKSIHDFALYLRLEKSLSENSIEAYCHDVRKLESYFTVIDENITPEKVTIDHLRDFIVWLNENEKEFKERSQARLVSGIKGFFDYLQLDNLIDIDPTDLLESPKITRKLPVYLTIGEIDAIINSIDVSKPEGHRNRAILETLYSCGLRVSELVNLRIHNLFFKDGFIRVIGKGDKERLVPISDKAIREIDNYMEWRCQLDIPEAERDYLFLNRRGKHMTRVMVFLIIKDAAEKAGIQKNISPHTFRHSFATHLVNGGADLRSVQEMLGHESILTTELYTHLDQQHLHDTIMLYHPRK